jgi:putative hydrolase of HD superfamily
MENLNISFNEKLEKQLQFIVEIDAGDTFLYSENRNNVYEEEAKSAERIFGLLEKEQKDYFIKIWKEFEERKTNEAKFSAVFDRLEPIIQNYISEGYTWKKII